MRALAILLLCACETAPTDPGTGALLRVSGAQFYPGAMPAAQDGPAVKTADLSRNQVTAGSIDRTVSGSLDPDATAAAIGLAGDSGYWVLTAGPMNVQEPGYPTFLAHLGFSSWLPAGDYQLIVRAVDRQERFGAPQSITVHASGPVLPDGMLVVTLRWDTDADLDLHVTDPSGAIIWAGDINSYMMPPPGTVPDPNAWKAGGILDFDSNAQCAIDGRLREDVIWTMPPPSGHYTVKVDAFSMCGQMFAHWSVDVRLAGELIGHASGAMYDADTRGLHGRDAGLFAVGFDVP